MIAPSLGTLVDNKLFELSKNSNIIPGRNPV